MPSNRRLRVTGCIVVLTFLIILYVTRGASNTQTSPFYTRTVEAIRNRHDAASRQALLEEEKERKARLDQIEKEHEKAWEGVKATASSSAAAMQKSGTAPGQKKTDDGKIVEGKPVHETDDGVAKVGNVQAKVADSKDHDDGDEETKRQEFERKASAELDNFLKKGPIIIFSKSYCRFSRKAKHILLELYDISPPPYVVELDQHELGYMLQQKLRETTGRGTVPNVMINGKSIGGGDDVEDLDNDGTLAKKIQAMGGRRIVEVKRKDSH